MTSCNCKTCNTALVPVTKRQSSLASDLVCGLLIAVGLVMLFIFWPVAFVMLAVGAFAGNRKVTVMTCPSCGTQGATLDGAVAS